MSISVNTDNTVITVGKSFYVGQNVKGPSGPATILAIDPVTHRIFIRYEETKFGGNPNACPHIDFIEEIS